MSISLRRSARTEAVTAQDGSARRWFERDWVRFAALVASDLESLTFSSWSPWAEVCAPRITTRLTTLRMSQVTFPIVFLFTFRKGKRGIAFRTRDFKVWHRGFSTRLETEDFQALCSSECLRPGFFRPADCAESAFSQTPNRGLTPSDTFDWAWVYSSGWVYSNFCSSGHWNTSNRSYKSYGSYPTDPFTVADPLQRIIRLLPQHHNGPRNSVVFSGHMGCRSPGHRR